MAKDKKRKRTTSTSTSTTDPTTPNTTSTPTSNDIDTSKPTALFQPNGPRNWTLSLALPGSIISNAKSHESKTFLAGQIARALAVFSVDEVVIFNDSPPPAPSQTLPQPGPDEYTAFSHPDHFLAHLLSYLETPAHLRKALFGMHPNLRSAGTLPSLDMPHHLRANEWCEYREGVVVSLENGGCWVDVGFGNGKERFVESVIPVNSRVTVKLEREGNTAEVVSPSDPREVSGYYWGYTLRQCSSLSAVLTECPFDGGYDLSIGTSERGQPLAEVVDQAPGFKHLLLVFGGVAGLETAAANDPELKEMGISKGNVGELFDLWVNVLPGQGSRTIRTEEAVWLGLMGTRALIERQ